MKFLVRVQGHMFLVVEDDLESAEKAIEKMFGKVNLVDLTEEVYDFIIGVELFDGMSKEIGLLKLDNGGH